MSFALLLSSLPQVELARSRYNGMLVLHDITPRLPARLLQRIKQLFS